MSMATSRFPAFALFPLAAWRDQFGFDEWLQCLNAWLALIDSHLSLSQAEFLNISAKDSSLSAFLTSFTREAALSGIGILGLSQSAKRLSKDTLLLTSKLLQSPSPPSGLAQWEFLADLTRAYGRKKTESLLSNLSKQSQAQLDSSLAGLKKFLIKDLDAGLSGDLRAIEEQLDRVNDLIAASPSVAAFFLAGSDFLDGLITCYKIMNPPLRKVILTTTYLCFVGLVDGQKISTLTDQLYSLKAAADAHKTGPLNVNDSLVAELVTSTPFLQQLETKLAQADLASGRTKSILADLATFKKAGGGMPLPRRRQKRKVDKGKGIAEFDDGQVQQEIHIHRMTQVTQIQDLFPDLGSGFICRLLDEYSDNTEQVLNHLLEDSLPPHLQSLDRKEELVHSPSQTPNHHSALVPRPTPPLSPTLLPERHNVFDNDDLDLLAIPTANLQLGKRSNVTADTLLADRSKAPTAAAIYSALAAFDSDDDERDDTYDAADVGGTVDATTEEDVVSVSEGTEATLFQAFHATPKIFERDNATRRGADRARLRLETGMTDEAIEGWAIILNRDPQRKRRLQARFSEFTGAQTELGSTAWRQADVAGGEGTEDSDSPGPARGGGYGRGRGGGGGNRGRGGRGGGTTPSGPPETDAAKRRKEANKGSRANHNRRDQRAKKMARGGL
ncbi:hypothetical protein B0T19DRAFT_435137 [Cercophora scortea]|uniref:CUE domain-containing protein n=1 Tax=Cercophora scortea TaxID=314031 RepID=A0AAE0M3P0_9PEZI|nr:hypothetical protein B0T19DRAFT_435137 [Cercophora scortea]